MNSLIQIAIIALALIISPSQGQSTTNPSEQNKTQVDYDLLVLIQKYFKQMSNQLIHFEQKNDQTAQKNNNKGTLLLSPPYHFRCTYDNPRDILITGTKKHISVYDYTTEQVSYISRNQDQIGLIFANPDFINDPNIKIYYLQKEQNIITLQAIHKNTDSQIKIYFNYPEIYIVSLQISENNNTIYLNFEKPIKLKKIDSSLFKIKNPQIYGKPPYLSLKQMEQYFEKE